MPGTKTSERPRGNPRLIEYHKITTDREEVCDRPFLLRIPIDWKEELNEINENWSERIRQAFAIEFEIPYEKMPENRDSLASTQPLLFKKRAGTGSPSGKTEVINIYLPKSMKEEIENVDYKNERARRAIAHEFGFEFGSGYVELPTN